MCVYIFDIYSLCLWSIAAYVLYVSDLWPIAKSCTADDTLVLAVKLAKAIRVHLSQGEKERERHSCC